MPRQLRHDLGEYYTPDWLAELTLDEAGYYGEVGRRLLDPACGSGTFLVLAIRRARAYADEHLLEPRETVRQILGSVVGFDLNPLAVIAARTNYLLALGTLVRYQTPIEIPIYLCDSVLTPAEQRGAESASDYTYALPSEQNYVIPSTVGAFHVPRVIVAQGELPALTALHEDSVHHDYSPDEFRDRARRQLKSLNELAESSLESLFRKIRELEREGRNGLWARVLKNAFAPVFVGTFDYVVGNPPWVNWESLSDDYRGATAKLWQDYGLFSLRGHAARLGGGKKDLAMLMLYVAADNYLREHGRLAFVITQTVFKTMGAGDGFRRFQLGGRSYLKVLQAQDLSKLQPFEGATNLTATILLEKGASTTYPVPYTLWRKSGRGRLSSELALRDVRERTVTSGLAAQPVSRSEPTSPWITTTVSALDALQRVIGPSSYRAYAGACTCANGVFWLRVISRRADGLLVIENLRDEGRLYQSRVITPPLSRGQGARRGRR